MPTQDSAPTEGGFVTSAGADLPALVAMRANQEESLAQTRSALEQLGHAERALLEAKARFGARIVELVGTRIRSLGLPSSDPAACRRYFAEVGDIAATVDRVSPDFRAAIGQAMGDIAAMEVNEPVLFIGRTNPGMPNAGGILRVVRAEAVGSRTRIGFVYSNGEESRYAVREVVELVTACGGEDDPRFMPATDNILSGRKAIGDWVRDEWDKDYAVASRCAVVASLRHTGMALADCIPLAEAESFAEELADQVEFVDRQPPTKALNEKRVFYNTCLGLIVPPSEEAIE